jgi:hypothetical protein
MQNSTLQQAVSRWGGFLPVVAEIFARPRFPPPPNFVFRFAKCAAKEDIALAPTHPCAGNDKELHFVFTKLKKFDNIVID